jgi:hypothetical protein
LKYLNLKYLFLIIVLSTISCNSFKKIKDIDAKIIKYRVEYLDEKAGNIPTRFLPSKMTLIFADHFAINSIEGFMGQFSLTYIANRKKKTVTTLLKIFDQKFYYIGKEGELPCGIDPMTGSSIVEGSSQAEIAGLTGKEKILKQKGQPDINIYTTDEIKVKNPNNTTSYKDVDEVLLVFYSKLSIMKMMFFAEEYAENVVSSKILEIPEGYKALSRAGMEKTIEELFK